MELVNQKRSKLKESKKQVKMQVFEGNGKNGRIQNHGIYTKYI